ncbi:helix-turn-helix transcriptional regulator [Eggerthella sinensis]|uniref:LuxR family transcriptional regulator n=1 Tax=Eggerthella sinensis TaxID=242230 RepID=A0A3N0IZE8_9ACTN|nr:helix-turn-helix transcriptional regulator [Eggerthella sinensis]RDB63091.1 LuxR family transcriptional regulator [Eggerthella sinensis]RNM42369.1 LuxR family transcriptional regulator [Eggerthella sinensis]
MEQLRSTRGSSWGKDLSLKRVIGFSFDRLWMLMAFYSIVPYLYSSDVRGSLYTTLFISLCAMVVTLLFVSVIMRGQDSIAGNRTIVAVAAAVTCVGSLLTPFSDLNTTYGMLILGISSIMTGTGSAVLFLGWIGLFSGVGGRLSLFELSAGMCVAFVVSLVLVAVPPLLANIAVICLPLASGFMLGRLGGAKAPALPLPEQPPSGRTVGLFAKALAGAVLVGMLEGFFDVLSGYRTFEVQDVYGMYLLAAGFFAMLAVVLIAVFLSRDGVFFAYRFAMLLLCLGCLLTPFMGDNNTYSSAIIFGGYNCFTITLCVVCIDVARSFRIGAVRTIGLGLFALCGGEVIGSAMAHGLHIAGFTSFDLAGVTLVAVSALFVAHLFLFTETDLIKLGIGEVSRVLPGADEGVVAEVDESVGEDEDPVDPCDAIVEKFSLSPRESDVLPLLLQGRTISRIQETLFISAGTVSTHIRHIYQKTGVDNRQELIDLVERTREHAEEVE